MSIPETDTMVELTILHVAGELETHKKVILTGKDASAVAEHFAARGHRVSLVDFEFHIYAKGDRCFL